MSRYHWALLVGPKREPKRAKGTRYHARNHFLTGGHIQWIFEEQRIGLSAMNLLLVRVMIGKVKEKHRLVNALRSIPIRQSEHGWNCVIWVREALEALQADGKALGTAVIEWSKVRDAAMTYCQKKRDEHRFDKYGNYDMTKVATYDLIQRRETIP
jgi:hypothetical protein